MERLPQNKYEINTDRLSESVENITNMYIQAAENFLEEGDSLRNRINDFYSKRSETKQELLHFLEEKNEEEVSTCLKGVKNLTEDATKFIERMERLYEIQDVYASRRELEVQDRLATDEEYELGVYVDFLASQVREAVLIARKKGCVTFQSGFREKTERDQFIDFHNRNIVIPEKVLMYFHESSIEIKVETFEDRTTITLHPVGSQPIRLNKWKEVWNHVIEGLPMADGEIVPNAKSYRELSFFRNKQDFLRKKQ